MFSYSFMQNALLSSIFIGILCPAIGLFLVLRKHSMIGDTLAHSSLAGVSLGLIFNFNPILSAFIFTSICSVLIEYLKKYFKKFGELILVIILSLCVGIAVTLISSGAVKGNINSFLFGSILTISNEEVLTIFLLTIFSLLVLRILFSKLIYISYDEEGAYLANIKVKPINYIFAILVSSCIAVTIRMVGVLVLSSIIAIPPACALQFKKGFKSTFFISIAFGLFNTLSGLFLSYFLDCAPGGITALVSVLSLVVCMFINRKKIA